MSVKVKCVHCGTLAHEFAVTCPKCGKPVANKDAPTHVSAAPWQKKKTDYSKKPPIVPIVLIAVIAIAAAVYFFLFK